MNNLQMPPDDSQGRQVAARCLQEIPIVYVLSLLTFPIDVMCLLTFACLLERAMFCATYIHMLMHNKQTNMTICISSLFWANKKTEREIDGPANGLWRCFYFSPCLFFTLLCFPKIMSSILSHCFQVFSFVAASAVGVQRARSIYRRSQSNRKWAVTCEWARIIAPQVNGPIRIIVWFYYQISCRCRVLLQVERSSDLCCDVSESGVHSQLTRQRRLLSPANRSGSARFAGLTVRLHSTHPMFICETRGCKFNGSWIKFIKGFTAMAFIQVSLASRASFFYRHLIRSCAPELSRCFYLHTQKSDWFSLYRLDYFALCQ